MSKKSRWDSLKKEILKRDEHICQYCGYPADEVDHIIPRSQQGPDVEWNLVAACNACNDIAASWDLPNFEDKKNFILKTRRAQILGIPAKSPMQMFYEAWSNWMNQSQE